MNSRIIVKLLKGLRFKAGKEKGGMQRQCFILALRWQQVLGQGMQMLKWEWI